jgi:hypothetical protein
MGPWELWAALIVGAAVWIVGHLLKNSAAAAEEEKRRLPRPPGAEGRGPGQPRRPAAASTDLDRFLQEVNRRKQSGEQRARPAESRQAAAPAARSTVDAPLQARPAPPVRRPPREAAPVVRTRQPGRASERDVPVVSEVILVEPTPPAALPVTAAAPPTKSSAFPPPQVHHRSPAMRQLATLLRSKDALQAGILFGVILAPPVCHRRR